MTSTGTDRRVAATTIARELAGLSRAEVITTS
jgi:hypothetical protein